MTNVSVPGWAFRFVVLLLLFIIFYAAGALAVFGLIPDLQPEPGLVPAEIAIMIIAVANTLLLMGLVLSSRWSGWKLAFWLAFAYYGAVTFIMQIETWYFLTGLTVGAELLPRLFLMGLPVAVFVVPLAVWILGKGRPSSYYNPDPVVPSMPVQQWVWRLAVIAAVYIVLYWTAGYFIAWQNPELRAFYGSPGEALPFWTHTLNTLQHESRLFLFQGLRGLLWAAFAFPIIRGSKAGPWWTAVLVGLLFSVPQNIGHIMENPMIPAASVRFSHLIETASSTFIFGMIVSWLLYRRLNSWSSLFPPADKNPGERDNSAQLGAVAAVGDAVGGLNNSVGSGLN